MGMGSGDKNGTRLMMFDESSLYSEEYFLKIDSLSRGLGKLINLSYAFRGILFIEMEINF